MPISKTTFKFLKDLKKNNNKEWFNDNKPIYKEAYEEFVAFTDELIEEISTFDKSIAHHTGKSCVFRIYKDVRFSKDKTPYKTNFGAHITSAGKKSEIHSKAGYYIHIEPGNHMLAGGAYLPQGKWIKAIREEIAHNPTDLRKILKVPSFKKHFGEMEGEQLKTAPRGYEKDHPEIDLLRYKSFLATHRPSDKEVLSSDFVRHCGHVFKALKPFDDFLNGCID